MIIGIVTTWFERGAGYVSRIYKNLLEKEGHKVYVFARGGENPPEAIGAYWNEAYVTRSNRFVDSSIDKRKFYNWIRNNNIEVIFFNEQKDFRPLIWIKKDFPGIKTGAYVDYYTERTIPWFDLYDFLICNTKRHMQAMNNHPQKYYVKWGTELSVFRPKNEKHETVTFFHSVGMSKRKGTDILIKAFIKSGLFEKSNLLIHSQLPITKFCQYSKDELKKYKIEVIEETVPAPGLYYRGDVYVYPTRLDGLGLTMYEAVASGLPIIVTDFPPMNEVGDESFVKRVNVAEYYCRGDGYYYPMAVCDEHSLIEAMTWYVEHPDELGKQKRLAREYAIKFYNIEDRSKEVSQIFELSQRRELNKKIANKVMRDYFKNWNPIKRILVHRFVNDIRGRL